MVDGMMNRSRMNGMMNWSWVNGMMNWSRMDGMMNWSRMDGMMNRSRMNGMMNWSRMDGMMNWSRMDGMMNRSRMNGMMNRSRMDGMMGVGVGNRRRCGVDGMVRYRVYRRGDGLAVLVQDWLGQEGVEERVSIESVQRRGLGTVNRVPGLTSEQVLVEESPIGTDKACTVGSVSPILTDSVGLTAGLRVCVHSWAEGGGGAGELGVRSLR